MIGRVVLTLPLRVMRTGTMLLYLLYLVMTLGVLGALLYFAYVFRRQGQIERGEIPPSDDWWRP